jgi:hypothetical protein
MSVRTIGSRQRRWAGRRVSRGLSLFQQPSVLARLGTSTATHGYLRATTGLLTETKCYSSLLFMVFWQRRHGHQFAAPVLNTSSEPLQRRIISEGGYGVLQAMSIEMLRKCMQKQWDEKTRAMNRRRRDTVENGRYK